MWQPLELKPIFFSQRSPDGQFVTLEEYRELEQELKEAKRRIVELEAAK